MFSFLSVSDLNSSKPTTFLFGKLFLIKSTASKLVLATLYLLKSIGLEAPIKTWSLKIVTSPPSIFELESIFKTLSELIWFIICSIAGISLDLFSMILEIKKVSCITNPRSLAKT